MISDDELKRLEESTKHIGHETWAVDTHDRIDCGSCDDNVLDTQEHLKLVAALIARLKAAEDLLGPIERRCGSASIASGFTDAQECAEWVRRYLASIAAAGKPAEGGLVGLSKQSDEDGGG